MSVTTMGTCSICGGPVTVPTIWFGVVPPIPTCQSCGAIPESPHGPVIPMRPIKTTTYHYYDATQAPISWQNDIPGTTGSIKVK